MPLFNVMFTLTFIPPFKKKKTKRDAWAIWLWLGPWRNHYPHDPKLLIPSLTPPSVSHFSHSLDKFIYMKDHSYWHGPAGKWQSNQWFHAILPSPSYVRSPRAVVSVSLINLPLSRDWRDQHVLIILPWFELDQCSVQLHKHSTSERDKHPIAALCIQKAGTGTREDTARHSVFLSVCLGIAIVELYGLFSGGERQTVCADVSGPACIWSATAEQTSKDRVLKKKVCLS